MKLGFVIFESEKKTLLVGPFSDNFVGQRGKTFWQWKNIGP